MEFKTNKLEFISRAVEHSFVMVNLSDNAYGQSVMAQINERPDLLLDTTCLLFEFVLNFLITGFLCISGFIGNTMCFITLWTHHHNTTMTFLLQGVIIADFVVVWIIFVEKVIPGLGYIVPLLRNCYSVCYKITSVTRPLLTLAESCVIWLTLCAAINRYMVMNKPSKSSLVGTLEFARKQVILVLACSAILVLPLTFDSAVKVADAQVDSNIIHSEVLRNNLNYKKVYVYGILRVVTLIIPWIFAVYLAIKLGISLYSVKKQGWSSARGNRHQSTELIPVILTLCITLSVCYMPSVIQGIVFWVYPDQPASCGHLHYYMDNFCKMFKSVNSCLMLLILCLFLPKFPKLLQDTFCSNLICCKKEIKSERTVRFKDYKCEDTSEMTLMSLIKN